MTSHSRVSITESTQVGQARRLATSVAESTGLDETTRGRVAIIATEMGNNLVRHAGGGELLIRSIPDGGIELLSLDKGPGIESISQSMQDGFSTAGTRGAGLGAIRRLSEVFEIYSRPGSGTAMLAQCFSQARVNVPRDNTASIGGVNVPVRGEEVCGDAWTFARLQDGTVTVMVADGLGHGTMAAEAAVEAVRIFGEVPGSAPGEVLHRIHLGLKKTRGAAVAIAEVVPARNELRFAGLGNIGGVIVAPNGSRNLVSHNGTAGHDVRKIQEFKYEWNSPGMLVMYSDGVTRHWDMEKYPGLFTKHPTLIAGVLYRDCNRGRDDATVVVLRA